jgi:hypothetical protein
MVTLGRGSSFHPLLSDCGQNGILFLDLIILMEFDLKITSFGETTASPMSSRWTTSAIKFKKREMGFAWAKGGARMVAGWNAVVRKRMRRGEVM